MSAYPAILIILLASLHSMAQVSGTVVDSKTKRPLPDVEVFIHGKTVSALSDAEGQFVLDGLQPGFNDLVLYKKGYQLFKSSIRIETGKAYAVQLSIDPTRKEKGLKQSPGDHAGEIAKFKEALFGKEHTSFVIMNQADLTFVDNSGGLQLRSRGPVVINHADLGYQLRYYILGCTFPENKIQLQGYVTFLPMQAQGSEEAILWSTARINAYQGSLRHLFKSLAAGKSKEEGFSLQAKNGTVVDPATLVTPSIPYYHKILFDDAVTVQYKDKDHPPTTSELTPKGSLQISDEGILLIPQNLDVTGHMANNNQLPLLPNDYLPVIPEAEDFLRFFEKIYVQTDKPYYYPGEPLWFKGYVSYYNPAWRDSLSQVVYVEIIHPEKSIVMSETLRIDSGFFHGDFVLPDTLSSGGYYLRAYTQLSRNFGEKNLFVKSIPVLNMTDKADPAQAVIETITDNGLTITTDKPKYKPREKITLTIVIKDKERRPAASNLSVAVTDAVQVVPVAESVTILNGYPIDKSQMLGNIEFKYPVEFGVGYTGRFNNDNGRPEKTSLTIMQLSPRNVLFAETNEEGYFTQTGLHFYDTASFAFKSDKARERPYGKVKILAREYPAPDFKESTNTIHILKTETAQRLISEYEVPKDSKLLETIQVKASRLPRDETDQPDYRMKRPYGRGDYVLKAKDINTSYGNLLYAMQGKFPGLVVRQTEGGWAVYTQRSTANSISSPTGILVTINDVAMGGNAADILGNINPNTVESIEVTTRVNVLYGSAGANGVISIHTKQDIEDENPTLQNFQTLIIRGYDRPRKFAFPKYDDPGTDRTKADYRATIYWNPTITTSSREGTATVSFYSSDLPGRYRVVVEGVNAAGEQVRVVQYVEVESD